MSVGNNVLEEQPLLSNSKPPSYHNSPESSSRTQDGDTVILIHEDETSDSPKEPATRKQMIVHSVLTLLGLFILTIFIKYSIDADDIEFVGNALKSALGGGLSAMVLQVLVLMPLRTIMNYQYRYGVTTTQAIKVLYADGGWTRYYQGLTAALVLGPVSRFGDTAANAGILAFFESNNSTVLASVAAACFRMSLTPVDMIKTIMQIQGKEGIALLRVKKYDIGSLWHSAFATAATTFVGHYPWFGTYNYLDAVLPLPVNVPQELLRSAIIGCAASFASDTISNSLRVVKSHHQVNSARIGYVEAAYAVIEADGIKGLFGRGLQTRILVNGLQGTMFSMLWKLFSDM
ncbi:mitochondrial carrier [Rhizopogon vinicolor AM-OR11-026]|uniref:Mitochondrial carrier n=1 Tax=Rhizopogon vinicolor AM-OR11-026 TaxID=1314800 RepID=A0A1B7MHW6_9AGAM|nr:mitochondrial carrier [Rhizopogon vinicolor AM-OR11-026]